MAIYILGNGFDLAHKLPTTYKDFLYFIYNKYVEQIDRSYFLEKFEDIIGNININLTEVEEDRDKDGIAYRLNPEYVAKWFLYLLTYACEGECWNELEKLLGKIDYQLIIDEYDCSDNDNPWIQDAYYGLLTDRWPEAAKYLNVWLKEWITSIDLEVCKMEKFEVDITSEDNVFITFNYTLTLESLYNVDSESVLHLHGKRGDDRLIFGHGEFDQEEFDQEELSMTPSPSAADNIFELDTIFRKELQEEKLEDFLDALSNINEIRIIGFGFGKVDLPYIEQVKEKFPDANWILNRFNCTEKKYKKILEKEIGVSPKSIFLDKLL